MYSRDSSMLLGRVYVSRLISVFLASVAFVVFEWFCSVSRLYIAACIGEPVYILPAITASKVLKGKFWFRKHPENIAM